HVGKFEQAEGGTLFLDEIGDMPVAMQAKLLRVLEEGEVERVGGDKPVKVNVRVLVATHRNLEDLVKQNSFRRDLFHRIYVFPLVLPPLRERLEDFLALVAHFAGQVAAENGWKEKTFSEEAISELQKYSWPGNIRELRNVVERLVLLAEGDTVGKEDVQLTLPTSAGGDGTARSGVSLGTGTLAERTEGFEKEVLLAEIKRNDFHMTNVARALGLERSHLYKKCQQLGIDLQTLRKPEYPGNAPAASATMTAMNELLPIVSTVAAASAGVVAYGAVDSRAQLFGKTLCWTNSPRKLAITFDDGPNPSLTPQLF